MGAGLVNQIPYYAAGGSVVSTQNNLLIDPTTTALTVQRDTDTTATGTNPRIEFKQGSTPALSWAAGVSSTDSDKFVLNTNTDLTHHQSSLSRRPELSRSLDLLQTLAGRWPAERI